MRIYVASAFMNKAEVRALQQVLQANGHSITWDWTTEDASHLTPGTVEYYAYLEQCGAQDLVGVRTSDAVVVIAHPEMRDTRAEMGLGIAWGKRVFVLYPERAFSVFYGSCIRVRSIMELLGAL